MPVNFSPRMKLFCFHHAGGSAIVFRDWQAALASKGIEVLAAELPGRGRRLREPFFRSLHELVTALYLEIRKEAQYGTPIALFGVSLGSLIAYEVAQMLEASGKQVSHLVSSSFCAPPLFRTQKPEKLATRTDEELTQYLRDLGGTPEELLAEKEWRDFFFPALRADFGLMDNHIFPSRPKLRCPITAIGASGDKDYPMASVEAWKDMTTGAFQSHLVQGSHLYLANEPEKALRFVRDALR